MGLNIEGQIEKVNGKELSYEEFVERYLEKNQPVVLTGLMDGWRACSDWVTVDGQPNLHFISSHFGKSKVQVADCGRREFTDQKRVEMSVSEFIRNWIQFSSKEYSNPSNCEGDDQSLLYLKDWHFVKEYPEYAAYTTPLFFCDDWLNLYLDSYNMHMDPDTSQVKNEINCSDYRFVYMGSKGTWTPLHADVFRSYSWSANVCGKKKWLLLSPSQCHLVFDKHMKSSVYDIFDDVSESKFPGFKKAIWLECIQEQNEIIFVPSGWYHQVHNMEDTISINHNWFNAYNLSWVWKLLLKDYNEAKEYIEDIRDICDDFEGLCQRNLAVNTGMNFSDFFTFITRFSIANLIQLHSLVKDYGKHIYDSSSATHHLISNLTSIKKVALNMKSMESFSGNSGLLLDVTEVLEEPDFMKLCLALDRIYGILRDEQWKHSSDRKETMKLDFGDLYFIEDSCCKVSCPNDLIRLITYVVTNLGTKFSNANFSLT
ncbi:JmjC domain [Macleaya cordata]|uniref:JmjC domain n=1 Tax=Macleaya cordata TaxID=56857 RepID=A0A200RAY2_MACCD|nr:JmjC domain [Macleaya cordata]